MGVVVDAPSGAPDALPVAFVVPMQGATGLYGPSCLACGQLAAEELNASSGIGGRRVELVLVDAGRDPEVVAAEVARLVDGGQVEAIAGWHISAVRQAITRRVGGRVVYSYAAMHEGRDDTPGLFMLGERPVNQVLPAARWMAEHRGVRRWAVVGNDYVFPRVSSRAIRESLRGTGSSVVREAYVPLGTADFRPVLAALDTDRLDGVVMLLMGQDAVHFNRQFAAAGLGDVLTRLSPAVEENTLLGAGVGAHDDLWAAAAYFDGMDTTESGDLARRYGRRFGEWAPTLNVVGESCYEAVQFLARLHGATGSLRVADAARLPEGWFYGGPRGLVRLRGNLADQDVYLAQADGVQFRVTERIAGA